jgi:hypothetical protein
LVTVPRVESPLETMLAPEGLTSASTTLSGRRQLFRPERVVDAEHLRVAGMSLTTATSQPQRPGDPQNRQQSLEHHSSHHALTTFPPSFHHVFPVDFSHPSPSNCQKPPPTSPPRPAKARNSPQLTTNPEHLFYPQPGGPSTAIDFSRSEKTSNKTREGIRMPVQRKKPHPRKDGANNMPAIT